MAVIPLVHSGSMRTATERNDNPVRAGRAKARSGRVLRRSVTCQDVKGVLACRDGRWAVDNESEVRMLAALGADCGGALDRFKALAETMNAGLVDASGLRQLNGRLRQIAAAPEEELAIEWYDRDLMAQAAFACVCLPPTSHHNAPRWLAWALSARLEENLVRGSFPGPGWLTLKSRHRYWGWGFDRDTCWITRLPAEFWTRLKSHPSRWLRDAAPASDPRTTSRALRHLFPSGEVHRFRSGEEVVQDLVASHPNTPAKTLRDLGKHSVHDEVRLRVAQNKRTPSRLLELLAKDVSSSVRLAVASHPSTPTALAEALADDDSPYVRAGVARRADVSQRVLARLARDCDKDVRCSVALNPSARVAVVSTLSEDRIAAVRAAASSSGLHPYQYASLARDRATTVRLSVAYKSHMAEHLLAELAEDPKVEVRVATAWNKETPVASLETLARDPQARVRRAAAINPSTPRDSLRALARDGDRWVRAAVAHNASAPSELLSHLLKSATSDISSRVRYAVAANPAASTQTLRLLAADDDYCVQHALAENPSAPAEVLERLASLSNCSLRRSVASNPSTPSQTLARLAADQDHRVRKAAAKNLHDRRRPQVEAAVAAARNSTDWPMTCLDALRSAIPRLRQQYRTRRTPSQPDAKLSRAASRT